MGTRKTLAAAAFAVIAVLGLSLGTASAVTYVTSWGDAPGPGQLAGPYGVAVDSNGKVYVADTHHSQIKKYTSDGQFLLSWGSHRPGQLNHPAGVAVPDGHVYVADTRNNRIEKFTSGGKLVQRWPHPRPHHDPFNHPSGVAVDSQGRVYVADSGNDRIVKLTGGGRLLRSWKNHGPHGIAADAHGHVYVADSAKGRIVKFTSGGELLRSWGRHGSPPSQLASPFGVAVKGDRVYVADRLNDQVKKFTSQGRFLHSWGGRGAGPGHFIAPHGVAVDPDGNVYVADTGNSRIQKFAQP
jgi:DNA-binding beta-propeller fold protein YncE